MKFAIAAIVAAFLITAIVYPRLPEQIPSHWNVDGEVDATTAKPWGAFMLPLMMLGSLAMFLALPRISPKGYEVEGRSRAYRAIFLSLIAFMFAIQLMVLAWALGYRVAVPLAMPLLVGALFVILGNYISKVPRNFFIGIRTPWTLADEDVWFRTHRLGSRMFVAGGLVLMAGGPFVRGRSAEVFLLAVVITAALIPVVYSYLTYRKEHRS